MQIPKLERIPRFRLMPKRGHRSFARSASNAFKAAVSVAKLVKRIGRVRTQTSRRNNEGPSSAITTQKDSMSIYKRRRAPRKVRNRARKRYKNFIKKQLIAHRDNTNLFDGTRVFLSSNAVQEVNSITFGYLSTRVINDDVGDWNSVFNNYLDASTPAASKDFFVTGLNYDITITNSTGTSDANALAIELDIYEFVFRKNKFYGNAEGVTGLLVNTLADETKMPGATLNMLTTDVGYTPFDSNQAMKYIVIQSKQRYYLPRGESVSFIKNIKFSRPIKLISEDFDSASPADGDWTAKGGLTRGLILVQKGTLSQDLSSQAIGATSLSVNVQCRYKFKVVDTNPNQNAKNY